MRKTAKPKQPQRVRDRICDECAYLYDPHEIGYNGEPFLARCPFKPYSIFRRDKACEDNFEPYNG